MSYGQPGYQLATSSHHAPIVQTFIGQLERKTLTCLSLSPDEYSVLFISGSARETFIRMTRYLQSLNMSGHHVINGTWSRYAHMQANLLEKPSDTGHDDYVHFCANETVEGIFDDQEFELPSIVDVTSCLFSHTLKPGRLAYYASGQKIFSSPGFSVVIMKKEYLRTPRSPLNISDNLYEYSQKNSCCVTPPIQSMILLDHFLDMISNIGGQANLHKQTKNRAEEIYEILDRNPHISLPVDTRFRSHTAIVFFIHDEVIASSFIQHMDRHHVVGYHGHRSQGGFRISNYPGLSAESFGKLVEILKAFSL